MSAAAEGGPQLRRTGFDLQGHRGARALAPENSVPGFVLALELGVTTLEADLAVTADDVVVVTHDPVLNPDITRGPDGRYIPAQDVRVRASSLAELQRYDVGRIDPARPYARAFARQAACDGTRIPTLTETIEAAEAAGAKRGKPPRYNLEAKCDPARPELAPDPETFARLIVAELARAGVAARAEVMSFDWRVPAAVRRLSPELGTGGLTTGTDRSWPPAVAASGARRWSPQWRDLDAGAVALAHRLGLAVVPWTVNGEDTMREVIGLGVDGLITDEPDVALVLLDALGIEVA